MRTLDCRAGLLRLAALGLAIPVALAAAGEARYIATSPRAHARVLGGASHMEARREAPARRSDWLIVYMKSGYLWSLGVDWRGRPKASRRPDRLCRVGERDENVTVVGSPAGGRVMLVRDGKIWLVDLRRGARPRRVAVGASPNFSPDGSRIAYEFSTEGRAGGVPNTTPNVAVLGLTSGRGRVLRRNAGCPHWSADGLTHRGGRRVVWAAQLARSGARRHHREGGVPHSCRRPPDCPCDLTRWSLSGCAVPRCQPALGFAALRPTHGQGGDTGVPTAWRRTRSDQLLVAGRYAGALSMGCSRCGNAVRVEVAEHRGGGDTWAASS